MIAPTPAPTGNPTIDARIQLLRTAEKVGIRMNKPMQLFFQYSAPNVLQAFSQLLRTAYTNGRMRGIAATKKRYEQ